MTGAAYANWASVILGLAAAILWLWSARVRVPDYIQTTVNAPGYLISIISRRG